MRIFLTIETPTKKPRVVHREPVPEPVPEPEPEPEPMPVKDKATYLMRSTYIIVMHIFLTNTLPTEKPRAVRARARARARAAAGGRRGRPPQAQCVSHHYEYISYQRAAIEKPRAVNLEPKPTLVARKRKTNPYIDSDSDVDADADFNPMMLS